MTPSCEFLCARCVTDMPACTQPAWPPCAGLFSCTCVCLHLCRRAFYDKRVSQEVDGEALGEVRGGRSQCVLSTAGAAYQPWRRRSCRPISPARQRVAVGPP